MLGFLQSPFLGKKLESKIFADLTPKVQSAAQHSPSVLPFIRKWGLILFVSAWSFVLGIFVGRGSIPTQFDTNALQKELIYLKNKMITEDLTKYNLDSGTSFEKVDLGYHEALKVNNIERLSLLKDVKKAEAAKPPEPKKPVNEAVQSKPPEKAVITAKVSVPVPARASVPVPADAGRTFSIQVASFQDSAAAERRVEALKQKGLPAYKSVADIAGKGTWHRVRIGHFKSRNDAQSTADNIKSEHPSIMIVPD